MKKLLLHIAMVVFLFTTTTQAQNLNYEWSHSIGGIGNDIGNSMIKDVNGNIFIAGQFEGVVDFNPGNEIWYLSSQGSSDIFIQKYNAYGDFMWARRIGGDNLDRAMSISANELGEVYITGSYKGTVDFNPGEGIKTMQSVGNSDIFILKLDQHGSYMWARSFGDFGHDEANQVYATSKGEVYIAGHIERNVILGQDDFQRGIIPIASRDIYIHKLDEFGNTLWNKIVGAELNDQAYALTVDAEENVYVTGHYEGAVDFDPGQNVVYLVSEGNYDAFVQKFDDSGNFLWARSIGGKSFDQGSAITVDPFGNIIVTGKIDADYTIYPRDIRFMEKSNYHSDIFVHKLNASGRDLWENSFGGPEGDLSFDLTTDIDGSIYITGMFQKVVDFDPGQGVYKVRAEGGTDIFVQKLDTAGDLMWVKTMGSVSSEMGMSISTNQFGEICVMGAFTNSLDIDPGPENVMIASEGGYDFFVMKMGIVLGTEEQSITDDVVIYPNPTENFLTVQNSSNKPFTVRIYDAMGKMVMNKTGVTDILTMDIAEYKAGIYYVTLSNELDVRTYKVIKK